MGAIKSFTDLFAWKKGHQLVLKIYEITKEFPKDERFGLTDQMRRAAVSITSNIAEGFGRRTALDKNSFYYKSLTSIMELQNQLLIAKDLIYFSKKIFQDLATDTVEVKKLVISLMKSSSTKS